MKLTSGRKAKVKKQTQFSKKMCVASWCLMALAVFGDMVLSWFGREPIPSTTQALIAFVAVFFQGGYITQNIFRDTSANKHGIHVPGNGEDKHYIEHSDSEPVI